MPIPKFVHQTWRTHVLPETLKMLRREMQENNEEYKFILYDNTEMENFMKTFIEIENARECFFSLAHASAKAELWRYCILYKMGGIYLNIDARINSPIRDFIHDDDECIITRVSKQREYHNDILIFSPRHPILKKVIESCCVNIEKRKPGRNDDITGGPVFSKGVHDVLSVHFKTDMTFLGLYMLPDDEINSIIQHVGLEKSRFYGNDMESHIDFKHIELKEMSDMRRRVSKYERLYLDTPILDDMNIQKPTIDIVEEKKDSSNQDICIHTTQEDTNVETMSVLERVRRYSTNHIDRNK